MTEPTYIPLRLHTEFSITDGMVRIKKLIAKAQEYGLPALGISDLMNEFGLVKFYKACRSAGIKPVGAADVWIGNPNAPDKPFRAMLIIRNDAGYLRLSELLTAAYVGKDRNVHHAELNPEWLENGDNSGLICLSGAHYGEVGVNLLNGNEDAARAAALPTVPTVTSATSAPSRSLRPRPTGRVSNRAPRHIRPSPQPRG